MKVELLSRELIKPHRSTPPSLQGYRISLVDEVSPTMNTPTILYYPVGIRSSSNENGTSTSNPRLNHLKMSLAKVLTRFYPLAGRYMKDTCMVDCSDQGAEFVEAEVDISLDHLTSQGKNLKVELLNLLLPRPIGAVDEVTDPLLAMQVSSFVCGGYAIGLMSSHRVADMSTTSTFINEWAVDAKRLLDGGSDEDRFSMSPSWNSALLFPGKKLSALNVGLSRAKEEFEVHKIITKIFFFNKSAISRIQEKAKTNKVPLPTRVQCVVGIIGKAIIDLHVANPVNSREFLISQILNMRERTNPPLQKTQCGNLYLIASAQSVAGERGVEFQSLVDMLSTSVKRGIEKCQDALSTGEEGRQMMVANNFHDLTYTIMKSENLCATSFSDLSKFPLYEADFGRGKPVWVSMANVPVSNGCFLLADRSGQGIEAWISLNVNDMFKFEKDGNIMEFTTQGKAGIVD